jgi:hypothetical protein
MMHEDSYIPDYLLDDPEEPTTEKRTKLSAPIGLKEVAEALDITPTKQELRKLRRRIQEREKLIQSEILIQSKPGGKYFTTMSVLRNKMPEVFFEEEVSELAFKLRGLLAHVAATDKNLETLRDEVVLLKRNLAKGNSDQTEPNGTTDFLLV